ncbi:MAG TPA: hypothetical protein VFR81_09270, partial [Longimicrobium sp.]|nr:hypothetical protein [Longimicrobium sp.]
NADALARFVELKRHDLNGDGRAEYFVRGTGPFCGASGNCREWVFTREAGGGYRLLLDAGGKGVTPQAPSVNGWRILWDDAHMSAYESHRDVYLFDGERYLATAGVLFEHDDGVARMLYRLDMPLETPRSVTLEMNDGPPGVLLDAEYTACTAPTNGRLCGAPRVEMRGLPASVTSGRECLTVEMEAGDGAVRRVHARCSGGSVSLEMSEADWKEIPQAVEIRLRAPGYDGKLSGTAQSGLISFAVKVLEMNGIDPYPDLES